MKRILLAAFSIYLVALPSVAQTAPQPTSAEINAARGTQVTPVIRATYKTSQAVTIPTAAASVFAVESPPTQQVRLRYMKICLGPTALQTTAGVRQIFLFRTTAASSGGSAQTPIPADNVADAAFGGVVRTGAITTTPAAPTQAANAIHTFTISLTAANPVAIVCSEPKQFDLGGDKPPLAGSGAVNGLALYDITGGAGGAGNYIVDASWTAE